MARSEIILGTPPLGLGGDPPRTASTKINAMTLELYLFLGGSGANPALPAALPVSKGGTGNTTGTSTKLSAVGMVGSVSQTGGVANGAVIERGANANGDYLRFADGTQFCWKRIAADATSSPVGSIFGSGAFGAGPYPASFNAAPRVSHSGFIASGSADSMWSSCYTPATQTSWGNYRILSASASAAGYIDVVAVGRWF